MEKHKQVRIKGYGQEAEIDEGIAPLIKELWRCGIRTFMSCEKGRYGFVWLNFENSTEAVKFMNIVATYDPDSDSLYQRMLGTDCKKSWIYGTNPHDANLIHELDEEADEMHYHHQGPPAFFFDLSIWFPRSDLPAVMERLTAYRQPPETHASSFRG